MRKIAILIPAYNEEKRIGRTLDAYSVYFENLRENNVLDYEILVVINNTTDRTEEIVKNAIMENGRIAYLNLKPGGKGFAVIEGFKDALKRENDLIGFVDADLATRPEDFYDLIRRIGGAGGAIASRYVPGARVQPKQSWQRVFVSRAFNFFIRSFLFLPYRDTQCGAKLFKRKAIEKSVGRLTMSQWAFDVDLIYSVRKSGFSVREVATRWSDREYSKINFWKAGPLMVLGVIRLRLLNSSLRDFIRIYDRLLNWIKNRK
ncbi:MAG: glycosyltransferase [Nanoarchaeota archaeon]|nr:glycosyltransferase [Nanoarchaeota archaeon]MBU1103983.1 glycosyltransferase [Nanoarchaeota archaeon]